VLKPFASLFSQASFCADLISTASPPTHQNALPSTGQTARAEAAQTLSAGQARHATRISLWIATCKSAAKLWETLLPEAAGCV
jgi:hypothetical protein